MSAPRFRLESPHSYPERLLLYGGGGSGKSTAIMRIAEAVPTAQVHVIETDISWSFERMMPEYPHVENLTIHQVFPGWPDFIGEVRKIVNDHNPKLGTPVSELAVLAVDSVTSSWDDVQSYYVDQVMGDEIGPAMMRLRKESKDQRGYMASLAEMMNWPAINKMYFAFYRELMKWRGHFVLTAEAAEVGKDDDARSVFGHLGVKPAGQKKLHHVASTNLLFKCRSKDTWVMTAAKDRERTKVENLEFTNFANDYLADVAGWERVRR